jgi:hypothetical protein
MLGFVLIAVLLQSSDVSAFYMSCNDFWMNGWVEGPDSVEANVSASFYGEAANGPGGSGPGGIMYWVEYGDGAHDNGRSSTSSVTFALSHTYAGSGPYTVTAYFTGKNYFGEVLETVACETSYTIQP